MILYHGTNVYFDKIDLGKCSQYKDFGQRTTIMQITRPEFQYMVEGVTTDLIVMLIERKGYSTEQAVKAVYASHVYKALLNPKTNLYYQSSGYLYSYLNQEMI